MALQQGTSRSLLSVCALPLSEETQRAIKYRIPISMLIHAGHLLKDKVVAVDKLCPLLLQKCLRGVQGVYILVLQTLQEVLAYFKCIVDHLGKGHWFHLLFALSSLT